MGSCEFDLNIMKILINVYVRCQTWKHSLAKVSRFISGIGGLALGLPVPFFRRVSS
jgi:hypothetical protein